VNRNRAQQSISWCPLRPLVVKLAFGGGPPRVPSSDHSGDIVAATVAGEAMVGVKVACGLVSGVKIFVFFGNQATTNTTISSIPSIE